MKLTSTQTNLIADLSKPERFLLVGYEFEGQAWLVEQDNQGQYTKLTDAITGTARSLKAKGLLEHVKDLQKPYSLYKVRN